MSKSQNMDWMYKGPNEMVNREEYLLGRPIDKSFEQMAQAEKNAELNHVPKNHVEYECIPPSLRNLNSGSEQVDLARKMQEDPLYAIKKKEMETRSQLLKNPVKLKQLRQLLEQQSKKSKEEKKHKKKKAKHKHDDSDEAELDNLLTAKFKELKDKITEEDLMKSIKRLKRRKKKKSKKQSEDSDSDSDSSSDESNKNKSRKKKKRSTSTESSDTQEQKVKKKHIKAEEETNRKESRIPKHKERRDQSIERKHPNHEKACKADRRERDNFRSRSPRYKENRSHRDNRSEREDNRRHSEKESNDSRKSLSTQSSDSYKRSIHENRKEDRFSSKKKQGLSEEEKERRRQEMIANATWREKERERNVKRYREEEKKELTDKVDSRDFIRKQLVAAAEEGTVASRIKSNINNIQRSKQAMDVNFAKR